MRKDIKKILDESRWTVKYGSKGTDKYASIYAYAVGVNGGEYIFSQTQDYRYVHTIEHDEDTIKMVGIPFIMSNRASTDDSVKSFNGFVGVLQGYMDLETISEIHLKSGETRTYTEEGELIG